MSSPRRARAMVASTSSRRLASLSDSRAERDQKSSISVGSAPGRAVARDDGADPSTEDSIPAGLVSSTIDCSGGDGKSEASRRAGLVDRTLEPGKTDRSNLYLKPRGDQAARRRAGRP
ncbi:MAG: hypothetical protein H6745_15680 [Deltaproteobacteria bacterium]|nr:hypothetical protein [Deltaproteobacteria bacterium]